MSFDDLMGGGSKKFRDSMKNSERALLKAIFDISMLVINESYFNTIKEKHEVCVGEIFMCWKTLTNFESLRKTNEMEASQENGSKSKSTSSDKNKSAITEPAAFVEKDISTGTLRKRKGVTEDA